MAKIEQIEKNALKWLKSQVRRSQLVFEKSSIDKDIYNYLVNKSLLASLNKQYCFVKKELESDLQSFLDNHWLIIIQFLNLAFNEGWYFIGDYAYKLNLDNYILVAKQITISTKKKSNRSIKILADFEILATYDKDYDEKPLEKKKFMEEAFLLPKPEYLMIQAGLGDYITHKDELVAFMKSSERDEAFIVKYFSENSNPVLLARLIGALRQIEDFSLRIELEEVLKMSGVKITIPNPFEEVQMLHTIERPAYLNRFQISMDKALTYLSSLDFPRRLKSGFDEKDLDSITTDDAYHSLTIEGYTVTKALLDYLGDGNDNPQERFPEDLRNQLAAKGFMNVMSYIKKLIKANYEVNERLVAKLYEELWRPSISANLMAPQDIYRKHMVTIRGAQHVPPNHEKLPYLISELFEMVKKIDNGFAKAIFLHFFYVTVHPHSDGNGRISRFLMNLALIQDKYKWLTIPNFERKNYFSALEESQVKDDISFFANFILDLYKKDVDL
jgi:hypothetical protein